MNELKTKVQSILRDDETLMRLLDKTSKPYGIYFARPPLVNPPLPLLTFKLIGGPAGYAQSRELILQMVAYSATSCDQIMERVEELLNLSTAFTGMTTLNVSNIQLDSIGPDDFDIEFNCYTLMHRYRVFITKIPTR